MSKISFLLSGPHFLSLLLAAAPFSWFCSRKSFCLPCLQLNISTQTCRVWLCVFTVPFLDPLNEEWKSMKSEIHIQRQIQTRIGTGSTHQSWCNLTAFPYPQAVPFVIAFGSIHGKQTAMRNRSGTRSFRAWGVETNGVLYILSIQSNMKYLRLKPQLMVEHISPREAVCFSDVTVGTDREKKLATLPPSGYCVPVIGHHFLLVLRHFIKMKAWVASSSDGF